MQITIIYDCPLEQCDKLWLKRDLENYGYHVKTIAPYLKISNIEQKGKMGKIAARIYTLWQCVKAMAVSKSGEVVICWSQWSGILFNALPGSRRRLIFSYNWLTPMSGNITRRLYVKALRNPNLIAVINSESTRKKLKKAYGEFKEEKVICIPDVYDDTCQFEKPVYEEERYCFMGGRANRDWNTLMKIAKKCPQIDFHGVAAKADWDLSTEIPTNVKMLFDISAEEYYEQMRNAFLTLYPLKQEIVSGLINIVKSAQLGKPVLITDISVTRMYYPENLQSYLLEFGDAEGFINKIQEIWEYSKQEYEQAVYDLQKYIQNNYSPKVASECIVKYIKKWQNDKK